MACQKHHSLALARPLAGCLLMLTWCRGLVARAIRNAIHANRFARIIRNWNPYFYSASGRFAWITRISDSRESPDSRESCESIRANHATKCRGKGTERAFFNWLSSNPTPMFQCRCSLNLKGTKKCSFLKLELQFKRQCTEHQWSWRLIFCDCASSSQRGGEKNTVVDLLS